MEMVGEIEAVRDTQRRAGKVGGVGGQRKRKRKRTRATCEQDNGSGGDGEAEIRNAAMGATAASVHAFLKHMYEQSRREVVGGVLFRDRLGA